ncbi:hypothetical protein A6R68_21979 [Neotoma lepida]|uniref:C-type lectin domain-containing protein n=1 Tax=Neotoma lepida TaxID=56216 RepID=A0A1A6HNI4_NEOLE|nr:hypothetical protein A6R68_21979 [Neotoma lepida]
MNWNMIISGLIIVVIKVVGMTFFLLYWSPLQNTNHITYIHSVSISAPFLPTPQLRQTVPKTGILIKGDASSSPPPNHLGKTAGMIKYLQDIAGAEKYFVGLRRQPGERKWRWVNNSAFNGNVTNENQNFHCVTIGLTKTFDAVPCDNSYRWICEKIPR